MAPVDTPERRASLDQVAAALGAQLADVLDGWRLRGLPLADLPYAVLRVVEPLISLAADLAAVWYQDAAPRPRQSLLDRDRQKFPIFPTPRSFPTRNRTARDDGPSPTPGSRARGGTRRSRG